MHTDPHVFITHLHTALKMGKQSLVHLSLATIKKRPDYKKNYKLKQALLIITHTLEYATIRGQIMRKYNGKKKNTCRKKPTALGCDASRRFRTSITKEMVITFINAPNV